MDRKSIGRKRDERLSKNRYDLKPHLNLIYTGYVSDGMKVGEIIAKIENTGFNLIKQ